MGGPKAETPAPIREKPPRKQQTLIAAKGVGREGKTEKNPVAICHKLKKTKKKIKKKGSWQKRGQSSFLP